jgi:hypothetical protein
MKIDSRLKQYLVMLVFLIAGLLVSQLLDLGYCPIIVAPFLGHFLYQSYETAKRGRRAVDEGEQ